MSSKFIIVAGRQQRRGTASRCVIYLIIYCSHRRTTHPPPLFSSNGSEELNLLPEEYNGPSPSHQRSVPRETNKVHNRSWLQLICCGVASCSSLHPDNGGDFRELKNAAGKVKQIYIIYNKKEAGTSRDECKEEILLRVYIFSRSEGKMRAAARTPLFLLGGGTSWTARPMHVEVDFCAVPLFSWEFFARRLVKHLCNKFDPWWDFSALDSLLWKYSRKKSMSPDFNIMLGPIGSYSSV